MDYLILSTLSTNRSATQYIDNPVYATISMKATIGHTTAAESQSALFPADGGAIAYSQDNREAEHVYERGGNPDRDPQKTGIIILLPLCNICSPIRSEVH